jgi:ADP-heptose:LPS heptosyltransferase
MRRIDRWLGTPICAALTLIRKLRKDTDPSDPPASIVFIKLAEQGSTVLAWPAIANAAARVGGRDQLYFVVFEENRPVLDVVGWIAREHVLSIRTSSVAALALDLLRVVRQLRRLGVEAAIDLEFFARSSAILSFLSGARRRVGFHAFAGEAHYRGDLCTHRISFNPYLHTSQAFEILVDALDRSPRDLPAYGARVPTPRTLPAFSPIPDDVAAVRRLLDDAGCSGAMVVLLNANASDLVPLRRWPVERYVELARRLLAKYPECSVVVTGAASERAAAEKLVADVGSQRCVSLAGQTTFRRLLTLYTLSDVLVTNDSGPAHFAALTPIDVVTLFGPETPATFGALSPRSHTMHAGIVCSPCLSAFNDRQSPCRDNLCMQALSVEQVFEATAGVYDRRRLRVSVMPRESIAVERV